MTADLPDGRSQGVAGKGQEYSREDVAEHSNPGRIEYGSLTRMACMMSQVFPYAFTTLSILMDHVCHHEGPVLVILALIPEACPITV